MFHIYTKNTKDYLQQFKKKIIVSNYTTTTDCVYVVQFA